MRNALIVGVMSLALAGTTWYTGYTMGKSNAELACAEKISKQVAETSQKIDALETNISAMANALDVANENLSNDMNTLLARSRKSGPTTIVKEGKCTLQPAFVNDVNSAIDKLNSESLAK